MTDTLTLRGTMSTFGGPNDTGVKPSEGLALMNTSDIDKYPGLFLPEPPPGTTGLARRLNPDAAYIACRWQYSDTPQSYLRSITVTVTNPSNGKSINAQPVDWGPNASTGRVADLSPGVARTLGLQTNDVCVVSIPLPGREKPSPRA